MKKLIPAIIFVGILLSVGGGWRTPNSSPHQALGASPPAGMSSSNARLSEDPPEEQINLQGDWNATAPITSGPHAGQTITCSTTVSQSGSSLSGSGSCNVGQATCSGTLDSSARTVSLACSTPYFGSFAVNATVSGDGSQINGTWACTSGLCSGDAGTYAAIRAIRSESLWGGSSENPSGSYSPEPVNLATGVFSHQHTDLAIPGRGPSLLFSRSYNSGDAQNGPLGYGWTFNYNVRLIIETSGGNITAVTVVNEGGRRDRYTRNTDGSFSRPPQTQATLTRNPDGSFMLLRKEQTRLNFNSSGKFTSIADRNNNTTTISYDGSGRISSVTDCTGRSLSFTPDASGRVSQISDSSVSPSRTVGFQYDTNGDLVTVTDVSGGQSHFTYSSHRLLTIKDANGNTQTANIYDSASPPRVVQQTDALGNVTCIYYGSGPSYTSDSCPGVSPAPTTGQTVLVDPRGNKTTYDFDTSYRTTRITDALSGIINYTYDSNNNVLSIEDQEGHTTQFRYDSRGNVTRIIDALSHNWVFTYTSLNDIDLETDPRGYMTDYGYDAAGNLTSITRKDTDGTPLATTNLTRDPGGNGDLTTVTDANGHTTNYTYDSHGLLDTVDGPLPGPPNDLTDYNFDAAGRLTSVTDAESNTTSYQYDNQNNVTQVSDANTPPGVTTYAYDAKGNRTSVTDAKRQPVGPPETGSQCGVSGTGNGVDDDHDGVIDDGCPSTRFVYDDSDHLRSVIDALGRATSYEYDAVGNRSKRVDARSLVTEYKYDDLNRLYRIEHWNGEDLADSVDYAHYSDGLRQSMTDPTGTTSYEYFDNHQLKKVTDPLGNVIQYTYDPSGDRETITYPGSPSKTVTYTYDAFDRMKTVTDWLGNVTTYNYDDAGDLRSTVYPASTGITSSRDYDEANHLRTLTNTKGADTLSSFSYTLDGVGNRRQVTDNAGLTSYDYDDLYRLTNVTYPDTSATGYSYDPVGNRLALTDAAGTTTYVYDAADQLTSVTPPGQPAVNYSWDKNGNLTWRGIAVGVGGIAEAPDVTASASHGGSGPPLAVLIIAGGLVAVAVAAAVGWRARRRGTIVMLLVLAAPLLAEQQVTETHAGPAATPPGIETFTYDHENRLVAATVGGTASTYVYNGDGLRVSRTVGTATTSYTWDVASALPVILQDSAGNSYVYGLDLISRIDSGGNQEYHLYDGLGSTAQLADGAGAVAGEYNYDVFGSVRSHAGSATEWSFTGEQNDPTGLEYLRARYYDPTLGRFLSQDPFTGFVISPQALNRYSYVANRPVHLVDPWGLCGVSSWGDFGDCFEDAADAAGDALDELGEGIGISGRVTAGIILLEVVHLPEEIAIGVMAVTGQYEGILPLVIVYERFVWPADVLAACLISGVGPCGDNNAEAAGAPRSSHASWNRGDWKE